MRPWAYIKALIRWPFEPRWRYTKHEIRVEAYPWGVVKVPKGFKYDGASNVPDLCLDASAVHDWLYATGRVNGTRIRQDVADAVYAKMLREAGFGLVDNWRKFGLDKFGGVAWRKYRKMEDRGKDPLKGRLGF